MFKRTILTELENWAKKKIRKPLVIRGARQVGKTWLVRHFAKLQNKHLVEVNFEKKPFVGEDDRFPWGPVTFYRYKNGSVRKIIFDEAFQGVKYWILDEDFKIVLDFFGKELFIKFLQSEFQVPFDETKDDLSFR